MQTKKKTKKKYIIFPKICQILHSRAKKNKKNGTTWTTQIGHPMKSLRKALQKYIFKKINVCKKK